MVKKNKSELGLAISTVVCLS